MTLQRLRLRLYLLAFVDEFGPFYAVFSLWLNDNGVTVAALSVVFLTWSVCTVVLEIPSGAIADRVDRRRLLALAFGLRSVGIMVWLVAPGLTGAMVGAALWAVHSSLASGAWEAHIHDQLTAQNAEAEYPVVMARVSQLSHIGVASAGLAALGVLAVGGTFLQLGWVTVALHGVTIGLVLGLPNVNWVSDAGPREGSVIGAWWSTLLAGLREARASVQILHLVMLGAFVEGLFIFDEYVPLLARDRGADDSIVPLLVLVVWGGLIVGGEVAARRPAMSGKVLGTGLVAAIAVATLGLVMSPLWFLLLIAVAYAAMQTGWVVIDARLQERVGPSQRATVTSVKGFLAGLISGVAFVIIGFATNGDDSRPGLFLVLGVLAAAGLAATRWLPDRLPLRPANE